MSKLKKMIKLGVEVGDCYYRKTTGFLHFDSQRVLEKNPLPIPIAENMLYALCHIRTHTKEGFEKGKKIVEKLLHFQSENGNFPVYLHDYPHCQKLFYSLRVLQPLYWIIKDYSNVLSEDLTRSALNSFEKALTYCLAKEKEIKPSYNQRVLLYSISLGAKRHLSLNIKEDVEKDLEALSQKCDQVSWLIPKDIAQLLAAIDIGYDCLLQSPWLMFLGHLKNTYSLNMHSYIGPALREYQLNEKIEFTPYNLYMDLLNPNEAPIRDPSLYHLYSALIKPFDFDFSDIEEVDLLKDSTLKVGDGYSIATTNKSMDFEKGYFPLKVVLQDKFLYSLCMQKPKGDVSFVETECGIEIEVDCYDDFESLSFFLSKYGNEKFTDEKIRRATTFSMGEKTYIHLSNKRICIEFIAHSQKALAHLMRSNRQSQIDNKTNLPYDWHFYLRPIQLLKGGKFTIKIGIENVCSQSTVSP